MKHTRNSEELGCRCRSPDAPPKPPVMKKKFASAMLAIMVISCTTVKYVPVKAIVDHIEQDGDSSIVFVKHKRLHNNSGYDWYWAKFGKLTPDLKRGNVINLDFRNSDSCKCVVFKPLNIKR